MKKVNLFVGAAVALLSASLLTSCAKKDGGKTVKVGILHSLSGTMAISETSVRDAELLAINEINAKGGVLGKQIEVVQEDGASEPQIFAERARKLIQSDKVATIFGCWTSASRKAVKPVVEETGALLWYPVQYEGMEMSPNIMYMGAAPNQQAVPAVDFCTEKFGKKIFLVGSDYVFPRTANKIIKAQLDYLGGTVAGEEYTPMGHTDFATIVSKIKAAKPDCIINTLNGDSNVAFFKQLTDAGITASTIPVMSFSIAEEEVGGVGIENLKGHYVAWNYYQTTETPENSAFVAAYKKAYGEKRVTDDPIEAGYIGVYLWAMACEKAGSFDVEKVKAAAKGLSFAAPEGTVTLDGDNQHIYKPVRIGKINETGLIDEVWATSGAVKPDPYLSTYDWAKGL
ncbi:urea-binding protein [Treponema bryantii]|uniref:Urea-binding protein n=1 Tax=Treponema bryantii TaxID=163 RepID=A0A1H9JCX3_9SPIR|nr:urea ABC transporter substrate-binding protein [Treponema bryantii]SEQ84658.1 urea-binding protein [Treponema bryantii]